MKINFDKKKTAEAFSGLVQKTVDIGKNAASSAKNNMIAAMEKSKREEYLRRLKKYNPLFPEQYNDSSFNLPNIIMIVDDAVRKDIDVCEGAIGWLDSKTGAEVLYLYDEFVPNCGLHFIPSANCDAVYCVDSFDRSKFIRSDCIFDKAQEERLAELKHIAHMLGAKRCIIEISEEDVAADQKSQSAGITGPGKNGASANEKRTSVNSNQRSGRIEAEFDGNGIPQAPTLKWYAHDDSIKRLIEIRCDRNNSVKSETLMLSGASSATMTRNQACAVDGVLGKAGKFSGQISMDARASREHQSRLHYHIEF